MSAWTDTAARADFGDLVARWDRLAPRLAADRDAGMAWLHDALDAAIKLEFSTIPPYLCALWSMAPVPPVGHPAPGRTAAPEVGAMLARLDARYTTLLAQLGAVWAEGDQGKLVQAIETMFSLEADARVLMRIPIDPNDPASGTHGPCFRATGEMK